MLKKLKSYNLKTSINNFKNWLIKENKNNHIYKSFLFDNKINSKTQINEIKDYLYEEFDLYIIAIKTNNKFRLIVNNKKYPGVYNTYYEAYEKFIIKFFKEKEEFQISKKEIKILKNEIIKNKSN